MEELALNFIVHVGVRIPPGARRIIKLAYEAKKSFARPKGRLRRLWQSLGWRCWQVDMLIGARGGSYHLEVAAPPGIDVVGITAKQYLEKTSKEEKASKKIRWWHRLIYWEPGAAIAVPGYLPHVHINPPEGAYIRYRAAIFVRVSRPGWLTQSWLVALVISIVIVAGRFNLPAVYSQGSLMEAGTAATLLLALLAVFATMLVRPGEHPLASRLLLLARLLLLINVGVVLYGTGHLVLHRAKPTTPPHTTHPVLPLPVGTWTWLALVAVTATFLFTISWLLPVARPPRRE